MIKNNWLDENEKRRAKICVDNIKDKIEAIENELNKKFSYRSYIAEKIESVCWDSNVIKRISEMETEEEYE